MAWPQVLDFFGMPVVVEPAPGRLSGDAGLLPVRLFDEPIGLTRPGKPNWRRSMRICSRRRPRRRTANMGYPIFRR
jgi:hypothetical protein